MASGIGALQSAISRVKKKIPSQDKKVHVVYMNDDGSIDYPPNCADSVLVVPRPLEGSQTEKELAWEKYCES